MVHDMALWLMVWYYGSWYGTMAHGMVLWFMVWHYDAYGIIDHGSGSCSWYCTIAHGRALCLMVRNCNMSRKCKAVFIYPRKKGLDYIIFHKKTNFKTNCGAKILDNFILHD